METNYIPTKSIVETMTEARENLKSKWKIINGRRS